MSEKKYILVCEDDRKVNESVSNAILEECKLKNISVDLISTYNRDETLNLIDKQYFSLAVVDLNLTDELPISWKDTDGIKIIEKINSKKFGTKTMVVSANPETDLVFDLTKKYKISDYINKGASSIDSFSIMINKIVELLETTSMLEVSDASEVLMGVEGEYKYKAESSFCDVLGILHFKRPPIINKIVNKIYPCEYRGTHHLLTNDAYGYVKTIMWSYRYASFVGILVQKDNAEGMDSSNIFEGAIEDEILSTSLNGTSIEIFKLNL